MRVNVNSASYFPYSILQLAYASSLIMNVEPKAYIAQGEEAPVSKVAPTSGETMTRVGVLALLLFASTLVFGDQTVRGYYRQNGTYVQPYHRTDPNQNRYDNYSSQGNTNPYTGQRGHQPNEFSNPPVYNRSNPYGSSFGTTPPPNPYGSPNQQHRRSLW